jgi:hypothetical protein
MWTRSFPVLNWLGRGVDNPPPSSVKVKERVELYLYSTSGPWWPVIGWTVPSPYNTVYITYNCKVPYCCHSYCCVTQNVIHNVQVCLLCVCVQCHMTACLPQTVHYLLQLNSKPKKIIIQLTLLLTYLLNYLLHGAESFLRSQSRNCPHFMEPEGSLLPITFICWLMHLIV